MKIHITAEEGGIWIAQRFSSAFIAKYLMYPNCVCWGVSRYTIMPAAIRFPNGLIYDNILASHCHWPWRFQAEAPPKELHL